MQSAQRMPWYPSRHSPYRLFKGGIIPLHAFSKRHYIKVSVELLLLQNPGSGPIFDPPLQIAFSVGHALQVPGSVITLREYPPSQD